MHRTTALSLFLIPLLFLSGCNALGSGDNTAEPTVTPADVPTDERTPTPVSQLAPGLTRYGVVDRVALGTAHDATLSNTSYTYLSSVTERYANDTLRARQTTKARVVEPKGRFYFVNNHTLRRVPRVNNTDRRIEIWSDGTRVLRAATVGNNTTYQKGSSVGVSTSDFSNGAQFYTLFRAINTRVVDRKTRNGTTLYRIKSTKVPHPSALSEGRTNIYKNPRNLTFHALIDSHGTVHEYRLAYTATGTARNTNVTTRIVKTVRYTEIGSTTVERPSWYEAANQTTTPSRSR
jgi:hypothetical protein